MKTKIIQRIIPILFGIFIFLAPAIANNGDPVETMTEAERSAKLMELERRSDALEIRISELKEARKNAETASERKLIRKEARELKSELNAVMAEGKAVSGGIYIGSGALILILILLLVL